RRGHVVHHWCIWRASPQTTASASPIYGKKTRCSLLTSARGNTLEVGSRARPNQARPNAIGRDGRVLEARQSTHSSTARHNRPAATRASYPSENKRRSVSAVRPNGTKNRRT